MILLPFFDSLVTAALLRSWSRNCPYVMCIKVCTWLGRSRSSNKARLTARALGNGYPLPDIRGSPIPGNNRTSLCILVILLCCRILNVYDTNIVIKCPHEHTICVIRGKKSGQWTHRFAPQWTIDIVTGSVVWTIFLVGIAAVLFVVPWIWTSVHLGSWIWHISANWCQVRLQQRWQLTHEMPECVQFNRVPRMDSHKLFGCAL